MNASQVKYVKERAQKIYRDKQNKIQTDYSPMPVSLEQALEALRTGKFSLKEPGPRYGKMVWSNWVSFDEFPLPDLAERDKKMADLAKDYTSLMDELVLGDNEKALELLKSFENNE